MSDRNVLDMKSVRQLPGTLSVSCSRDLLLEKNGRSEGLGVEDILIVSTSGPESLMSSNSSNRSSISAGSMSVPTTDIFL